MRLFTYPLIRNGSSPGVSIPRPQRGSRYGLILGVKKSRPALPTFENARASVLITIAISWIMASSKAADSRIGFANDVA